MWDRNNLLRHITGYAVVYLSAVFIFFIIEVIKYKIKKAKHGETREIKEDGQELKKRRIWDELWSSAAYASIVVILMIAVNSWMLFNFEEKFEKKAREEGLIKECAVVFDNIGIDGKKGRSGIEYQVTVEAEKEWFFNRYEKTEKKFIVDKEIYDLMKSNMGKKYGEILNTYLEKKLKVIK